MDKTGKTRILISIIHSGDKVVTDAAISSVRNGSLVPDIAVVCTESEKEYFTRQGVIVITDEKNRGYSSRLNIAGDYALRSGYKHLIFSNNDVIVLRDTISEMYAFIQKNPESIVAPLILCENNKIETAGIRLNLITGRNYNLYYNSDISSIKNRIILPDAVAGTFFVIEADLFKKIRFDERYDYYFEDVSFCLEARQMGTTPVVLKNVAIIHKGAHSIKNYPKRKIVNMVTKNHLRTISKYSVLKGDILKIFPYTMVAGFNLLYFALRAKSPMDAVKGVVSGVFDIIMERDS